MLCMWIYAGLEYISLGNPQPQPNQAQQKALNIITY